MSVEPKDVVGKICKSMEKYFNTKTRKMDVKSRPVLVVGYEDIYDSKTNIDYEILPISKIDNSTPHPVYDHQIDRELQGSLGLTCTSYIRSNKTTWNHVKRMIVDRPIGDLKMKDPQLFNEILNLNKQWVENRNNLNSVKDKQSSAIKYQI